MSRNLQNFANFKKIQLENLVDFEKCCKTHILLQRSVPIPQKTSEILPKIAQQLATTPYPYPPPGRPEPPPGAARGRARRGRPAAPRRGLRGGAAAVRTRLFLF